MKVGRNEPCPCGSGRKYKKCCLAKDEAEAGGRREESSGGPRSGKIKAMFEALLGPEPAPEFPYRPESGPLHELAFALAELAPGTEPAAAWVQEARGLASPFEVIAAVSGVDAARKLGMEGLGRAYETLAVILMETLERQAAVGIKGVRDPLDATAAMIENEVATRRAPPEAREVFRELRRRVRLAPAGGRAKDADLDKVLSRIQALREKTVDRGCTEEEALAAAGKVAELLDRYGLSLSEVELKGQTCEGFGVDTGRKRFGPIDGCIPVVADFCDCRAWSEKTAAGEIRYIFFGLPADVAGARYLYEMIERAFETETDRFRAGDLYAAHPSSQRRTATTSFQAGLAHGIAVKLRELHDAREAAMVAGSGRDLVPLKAAVVEDELGKLGLNLTTRSIGGRSRRVLRAAYHAGHAAGREFEWRPGIGHG